LNCRTLLGESKRDGLRNERLAILTMTGDPAQPPDTFEPLREAALQRIQVIDRPDGGKEFILPALRNFREKIAFTNIWAVFRLPFWKLRLSMPAC